MVGNMKKVEVRNTKIVEKNMQVKKSERRKDGEKQKKKKKKQLIR